VETVTWSWPRDFGHVELKKLTTLSWPCTWNWARGADVKKTTAEDLAPESAMWVHLFDVFSEFMMLTATKNCGACSRCHENKF
jgi:hypothetical protein